MLQVKNTYIAIIEESVAYTLETPPVDADFILADADYTFEHGYEEVVRNAINGSLDALDTLRGMITGAVSLTTEMRASGTRKTAPEIGTLLEACFGTPTNNLATDKAVGGNVALLTVDAGGPPTASSFEVTHAHGAAWFKAGDVILVDVSPGGTGTFEQATILTSTFNVTKDDIVLTAALAGGAPTAGNDVQLINRVIVAGTTAIEVEDIIKIDIDQTGVLPTYEYAEVTAATTVNATDRKCYLTPYLSAEPLNANKVLGGLTYKMQDSGQITLSVHIFLDCVGQDGLWYRFAGCRPNLSLTGVETGQIPKLKFDLDPTSWTVEHTGSNLTTLVLAPAPDETQPPLCLGCTVSLESDRDALHTQKIEMDLGLGITKRRSMIPASGFRSSAYTSRAVTGVIDFDLDDDTQYTAWTADSYSPLLALFGSADGKYIVLIVPNLKRKGVSPVDTDGIWTQDVMWESKAADDLGPAVLGFF